LTYKYKKKNEVVVATTLNIRKNLVGNTFVQK